MNQQLHTSHQRCLVNKHFSRTMNLDEFEYSHGEQEHLKVCFQENCNNTAFVCGSCDECLEVHDHKGVVAFMKWSVLDADMNAITTNNSQSKKEKEISKRISASIEEVEEISNQTSQDLAQAQEKLGVGGAFTGLMQLFSNRDSKVTGADASVLIRAILNPTSGQKQNLAMESVSEQLASNHSSFLQSLNKLIDKFDRKRTTILTKQDQQLELDKSRIYSQSTFEIGDRKRQSKEGGTEREVVTSRRKNRKETASLSNGCQSQTEQKNSSVSAWSVPNILQDFRTWQRFTLVCSIRPGDQHLNLLVKVLNVTTKKTGGKVFQSCLLGDHSGVVAGRFFYDDLLQENAVLELVDARVHMYAGKMSVNMVRPNCICLSEHTIPQVDKSLNMSQLDWQRYSQQMMWRKQ